LPIGNALLIDIDFGAHNYEHPTNIDKDASKCSQKNAAPQHWSYQGDSFSHERAVAM